jgi:hypothetical protein
VRVNLDHCTHRLHGAGDRAPGSARQPSASAPGERAAVGDSRPRLAAPSRSDSIAHVGTRGRLEGGPSSTAVQARFKGGSGKLSAAQGPGADKGWPQKLKGSPRAVPGQSKCSRGVVRGSPG